MTIRNHLFYQGLFLFSLLLALLVPCHVNAAIGDVTVLKSFPAPNTSPDGITTDGTYLYVSECESDIIYKLSPEDGSVQGSLKVSGWMIDHLTWDGQFIWANDHDGKSVIFKIDIAKKAAVEQFKVPWQGVMGVAWDGSKIWTMDPYNLKVYTIDPVAKTAEYKFKTPSNNPCGIGWDGKCVWIGDLTTKRYYQVDPATGNVAANFKIPGNATALPTGILWDGEYFWVMDEYQYKPMIYKISVELPADGPCAMKPVEIEENAVPEEVATEESAPEEQAEETAQFEDLFTPDAGNGQETSSETTMDEQAGGDTAAEEGGVVEKEEVSEGKGSGCMQSALHGAGAYELATLLFAAFMALGTLRKKLQRG